MAQRVIARKVTVTAGTAIASPHTVDMSFNQGTVMALEIVIPDGHAGFTGLALQQAHQQIIPEDPGTWIIGNDDRINWPVDGYLNNGSWQASMYNTDVYDHSFYLHFLVDDITAQAATTAFATGAALVIGDAPAPAEPDTGTAPLLVLPLRPVSG